MDMDMERDILTLITCSGEARSLGMEAIEAARNGDFDKAEEFLKEADDKLVDAHNVQTSLLQKEASGENFPMTMLLIHAQDHLMNAITISTLAKEFINVYRQLKSTTGLEDDAK